MEHGCHDYCNQLIVLSAIMLYKGDLAIDPDAHGPWCDICVSRYDPQS